MPDYSFSQILFLILLGLIPSIVWLLIFLREDRHPEPKYLIGRTFLFGIIIAPIVVIFQFIAKRVLENTIGIEDLAYSSTFLIFAAFIEEYLKYWVVKVTVLNRQDFDEPVDAMIYMVSAAVGFAAIENILVLFNVIPNGIEQTLGTWVLRFTGATLLHALASATVGYFVALSWFWFHHAKKIIAFGIVIATILHALFNLSILTRESSGLSPNLIGLFILGIIVLAFFHRLRFSRPNHGVTIA